MRTRLNDKIAVKIYTSQRAKLEKYCDANNTTKAQVIRNFIDSLKVTNWSKFLDWVVGKPYSRACPIADLSSANTTSREEISMAYVVLCLFKAWGSSWHPSRKADMSLNCSIQEYYVLTDFPKCRSSPILFEQEDRRNKCPKLPVEVWRFNVHSILSEWSWRWPLLQLI